MRPLVTRVQKISQGSDDPTCPWARGRYNWIKQLAIRFGILDPTQFRDIPLPKTTSGTCATTEDPIRHEVNKVLNKLVVKVSHRHFRRK